MLAGGSSRRMGRDKALILWKTGETMLERTARIVREAVGNVSVLGPASRYSGLGLPILEDLIADCGPLGGLHTALLHCGQRARLVPCEQALLVPCDLPHLTAAFLQRMAAVESAQCVIARGQPLCGVYHRGVLPVVEQAIRARRLRMTDLAEALGAVEIDPDDPLMLQNRNTPGDWA